MKLVRSSFLLAFVVVFTGATDIVSRLLRRGNHVTSTDESPVERELWKNKFKKITVKYDPAYYPGGGEGDGDGGKAYPYCALYYELECKHEGDGPGCKTYKIEFDPDEIFEEGHKVKCQKKAYHPKGHLKLPVDIKVPNRHATWIGEKVTDAAVKWGLSTWSERDSNRLDVVILREPSETVIPDHPVICPGQKVDWKALYDYNDGDPKCYLTYKVNKGAEVKIPLPVIFGAEDSDSMAVKCVARIDPPVNKNTLCLPVIAEDITNYAYFVGKEDVQFAEVNWNKNGHLTLVIEAADPEPLSVSAKYVPHAINDPPCTFSYVVGGTVVTVEFGKDEVFEKKYGKDGDTVICKKKEHPKGGLELPIQEDFPSARGTWVGETVRDFEVRWGDDKGNKMLEVLIKRTRTCPEIVEDVIFKASLKPKGLKMSTSPQGRALAWLKSVADCEHDSLYQWIQAYALATIFYASGGENWDSADCWVPPFEEGVPDLSNACKPQPWEFVTCKGDKIIALEPIKNNLVGSLHPEIGLLRHLETIDMNRNDLDGEIPKTLGLLKDLEFLDLSFNDFSGGITEEICDIIVNQNSLIVDPPVHCPKGCCALSPAPTIAPTPSPTPPPTPPTPPPPPDPPTRAVDVEFIGTSDPVIEIAAQMSNSTQGPYPDVDNGALPSGNETIPSAPGALDAALDEGIGASGMPDPIQSFEGIEYAQGGSYLPPDTVGDVGPNHYVQMVNIAFAIYDKTGGEIVPPTTVNALFDGDPDCGNGAGDPIVLYDQFEDRWLLTQFTRECRRGLSRPSCFNCMAISASPDPTGRYHRYKVAAQPDPLGRWSSVFPDYPKYGMWRDSFVLTTRDFGGSFRYKGASVYAIEKEPMLSGSETRAFQAIMDERIYGELIGDGVDMLPADVDGSQRPPLGSPIPIFSSQDDDYGAPFDAMNVWEMSVDWSLPTATLAFRESLPVAEFSSNVCGLFCRREVRLPGARVDGFSYAILHRLSYRNFCGYESLLAVRGGVVRSGPGSALGVRWFEIRRDEGKYSVHQESTFSPDDGVNRWMASIAQDRKGNIAMGYSVGNTRVFPGIRYAGRLAGDELNKMTLGEATLIDGTGTPNRFLNNRWGDYSSMNIDPTDDCTFWYTNEYYEAEANGNPNRRRSWNTRIGSFVLPGCLH